MSSGVESLYEKTEGSKTSLISDLRKSGERPSIYLPLITASGDDKRSSVRPPVLGLTGKGEALPTRPASDGIVTSRRVNGIFASAVNDGSSSGQEETPRTGTEVTTLLDSTNGGEARGIRESLVPKKRKGEDLTKEDVV